MKKFSMVLMLGCVLTLTATSCHDEEHVDTDKADSLATMPAETPATSPAMPTTTDTVAVPPVDPAMDTAAKQAPKM